jgi:hypothetical protein
VPQSWLGLTWASLGRLPWIRAGFYYGPHLTEGGFGLIVARKAVRWPVQIGPDTTNLRRKGHGFQATEFSLVYQHGIPPSGYVYMVRTSMSRESPTTLPYHGPTGSPVASPSPHCTRTVSSARPELRRAAAGTIEHARQTVSYVQQRQPARDSSFFRCRRHAADARMQALPHDHTGDSSPLHPVVHAGTSADHLRAAAP